MAQIARAILLARAIATSMRGLRPSMRCSQVPSRAPLRQAQRTMTIAPLINSRRISRCPHFRSFPENLLASGRVLHGDQPKPGCEIAPPAEYLHWRREGLDRHGCNWPNARHCLHATGHGSPLGFARYRLLEPRDFLRKSVYLIEVYARQFDPEQRKGSYIVDRLSDNRPFRD